MSKENALRIYQHYNHSGLPLELNEDDLTMGFDWSDPTHLKIVVNVMRNAAPILFNEEYEYLNDNYYNIQNILNAHEYTHYKDFVSTGNDKIKYKTLGSTYLEDNAYNAQKNHWTWNKTTNAFKNNSKKYNDSYHQNY